MNFTKYFAIFAVLVLCLLGAEAHFSFGKLGREVHRDVEKVDGVAHRIDSGAKKVGNVVHKVENGVHKVQNVAHRVDSGVQKVVKVVHKVAKVAEIVGAGVAAAGAVGVIAAA